MSQTAQSLHRPAGESTTLDYLLYLPARYESLESSQALPLILFLHGAGERGGGGPELEFLKRHELPKLLESEAEFPYVVVSPQCTGDQWWSMRHESLIALLDHILDNYRVDADRVYLTGISMGGFGTFQLAFEYPERFAAIVPICGWISRLIALDTFIERLRNTPAWIFHGAKDSAVPCCGESPLIHTSQTIASRLREVHRNVRFTLYPELDHNCWTEAYRTPALYDWLLSHRLSDKA